MNLFKDIPINENSPKEIYMVVDAPKNSKNKYEYDEKGGYFSLDRTIYSPVVFPFDYGFIPQTLSEDGDPLDVVLLVSNPTFSGCVIKARPIGVMIMEDEAGDDNKIIAVPISKVDPRFKGISEISDLSEHQRKEIQEFFETYKRLEPGKFVKITGFKNREEAEKIINSSDERYKKEEK